MSHQKKPTKPALEAVHGLLGAYAHTAVALERLEFAAKIAKDQIRRMAQEAEVAAADQESAEAALIGLALQCSDAAPAFIALCEARYSNDAPDSQPSQPAAGTDAWDLTGRR